MLNYIKAELWKAAHCWTVRGTAVFLVLCTALFGVLMSSGNYAQLVSGAGTTMLTGVLAVPLLVQAVDGGLARTLKNEVSFGLSRRRIYLGKLSAGLLLGLFLCLLLLGGLLGVCCLALPHVGAEEELTALGVLGFCLLGALPVWFGTFAFCHAMAVTFQSAAIWAAAYYFCLFVGQPILVALSALFGIQWFSLALAVLMPYTLLLPPHLVGWLTWEYQLWCWVIGLGWGAVSTAAGLLRLSRKSIR